MNKKDHSLLTRSFKNISVLFFIVVLLLLFVVILINVLFGIYTWDRLYMDLINALVGVMIPLVLFNFLYDRFTQQHKDRELSEKITETMLLDEQVIDRFSNDSKKAFIQKSTESILGKTVGNMVYDTLIQSYLSKSYQYRHHFKYYISYLGDKVTKTFAVDDETIFIFNPDDYYFVREDLSFERDITNFIQSNDVRIGFSYKESTLDGLYQRAEFMFRENLWVNEEHNSMLQELSNHEMEQFVKSFLQFTIEIDGEVVPYQVIHNEGYEGFHLLLDIPETLHSSVLSKVHIRFQMPQLRTQKKFIVMISEPTEDVEIMFMHLENEMEVEAIPFLNEAESITRLPNDTIKIDIHDWILPRAGVVFVWNDRQ
ncbi:hypothetical protein [Gracilibacillus salinarum]|uniref:Uncharacterized protein n=1 Tax=Gracilibacillus salinarum TaxID=2932255 RepID=A0ABY4GHN2_9BACI|nr:hypothetical protein [Gracilibacillus salinarum]UOQ83764.1 hypothetical protein MUN87_13480 [Gracilibacillus salinarum]